MDTGTDIPLHSLPTSSLHITPHFSVYTPTLTHYHSLLLPHSNPHSSPPLLLIPSHLPLLLLPPSLPPSLIPPHSSPSLTSPQIPPSLQIQTSLLTPSSPHSFLTSLLPPLTPNPSFLPPLTPHPSLLSKPHLLLRILAVDKRL